MDADKELAEAMREAERVFGIPNLKPEDEAPGGIDETEHLEQPEEPQHLQQQPEQVVATERISEKEVEHLIDVQETTATALDEDEPWPDDIQVKRMAYADADAEDNEVISSSVIPYREIDTVLKNSDRPTIREKYVFRTQTGNKRRPLPAHKRWMQRVAEGRS